ncbi:MAG TPA: DNA gyrase C-terminal beta-propeller domain-containing protein, partial [Geminicoccaceae bacterium]|nr:DNA gyrase C-terminal beta-propeller domain-containing protein [Geminicoccaceae bacterium]
YIKRVPLSTYRSQRRGGKGRAAMTTYEDDFVTRMFVANTHTPVLFFSSRGKVYKLKVYKLPLGTPQARGKAMVNLLPDLSEGETVSAVLPLPEDEERWSELNLMFATAKGNVRRNELSDFTFVPAVGKMAMRLDEDDRLVGVEACTEAHDVLLASRGGKCIRFPVGAVRVFRSRTSDGVRGMDLAADDEVISMSVLDHVDVDIEERDAFLRMAGARRRQNGDGNGGEGTAAAAPNGGGGLGEERFEELGRREQLILSVTINGYGKRTSAYEYRITNRGGQGIINIETSARNGPVVAAFPVAEDDELMLITDKGKVIRIPVHDIRIAGRNTQGVTLFHTDPDEHVVSVERLPETGDNGDNGDGHQQDA